MKKSIGWWSLIALFAFSATANAQAASPPAAGDRFDGTYAFVSATTLNETYMTPWRTRMGRCGDIRKLGPLTVSNGSKSSLGVEIITRGTINTTAASTPARSAAVAAMTWSGKRKPGKYRHCHCEFRTDALDETVPIRYPGGSQDPPCHRSCR